MASVALIECRFMSTPASPGTLHTNQLGLRRLHTPSLFTWREFKTVSINNSDQYLGYAREINAVDSYFLIITLADKDQGFLTVFLIFLKILFIFREREREGEREGEKHPCVRETWIGCWGPGPQPRHVP